ncbi:MAG: peptidylprolyl isomerase [Arenimonas sp.]|nr:peptidylprolyl isomerase [Arenimonas sp.]
MKIEKNHVVRFHYTVSEPGQPAIETSKDREPLAILVGHGNIIPGLEAALLDKSEGDSFEVTVGPEEAYGERRDGFVQRVPKKHIRETRLKPGQQVIINTSMGPRAVTVVKVGATVVDVDLNHPMAGKTLQFQVDVVGVRAAEPVEIEHGHVHGDGGVQH